MNQHSQGWFTLGEAVIVETFNIGAGWLPEATGWMGAPHNEPWFVQGKVQALPPTLIIVAFAFLVYFDDPWLVYILTFSQH